MEVFYHLDWIVSRRTVPVVTSVLHKHPDGYSSPYLEDGLFIINNKGKIVSMTNNPSISKYDNLDLKEFKDTLKKIFEKYNKSK